MWVQYLHVRDTINLYLVVSHDRLFQVLNMGKGSRFTLYDPTVQEVPQMFTCTIGNPVIAQTMMHDYFTSLLGGTEVFFRQSELNSSHPSTDYTGQVNVPATTVQ